MSLGIHQIKNYNGHSSFFVQRSYGNYLIFGDGLQGVDYELLKSKGGVYRQFFTSLDHVTEANAQLFKKFGAAGVGYFPENSFNERIPLEIFKKDFCDHQIKFISNEQDCFMTLKQNDKKMMFMGGLYRKTLSGRIFKQGEDRTEQVYKLFKERGIHLALFQRHEGEALLDINNGFLSKLKSLFNR